MGLSEPCLELSLHTDLALRSLILLAVEHPNRVPAVDLATRHRVSYAHVQKVVQGMRRAMEPHLDLVECFDPARSACVLTGACDLTGALRRARGAFLAELDAVSLGDMARSRRVLRDRLGLA